MVESPRGTPAEREAYDELQCYTLSVGDPAFVHQHVVDAWTAQHADPQTKAIALAFALVGLYLHVEKGLTGRQVQKVHMKLARRKRTWPTFALPSERGTVSVVHVAASAAGPARVRAIDMWCASVWEAFRDSHLAVVALLAEHGIAVGCLAMALQLVS